jgi:hypothetical protein
MKTNGFIFKKCLLTAIVVVCATTVVADEVAWLRTAADGPSDWNNDANWLTTLGENFAPDASFDDTPTIVNGGTAFLAEPAFGNDDPFPAVIVGRDAAAGGLELRGGAELKTNALTVAGAASSRLLLSGDASLEVSGDASTTSITRVVGPDVDFSVTGDLTLGGVFESVITGNSHSAIAAGGAAAVSGTLRPEFQGVTPQLGDSWPLINAASVAGTFTVDASLAPTLDPGVIYASAVNATEGSVNLVVTNTLELLVNRRSGATSIRNIVGDPIQFDTYSISSESGRLDASDGAWSSLADSGAAGTGWTEGAITSTSIGESKTGDAATITVGSPVGIGAPVVPANFAEEDVVFSFSAGGVSLPGIVTYEDVPFNLVLNVDPESGMTEITNKATVPIEFDGYAVMSTSGALKIADGEWSSLADSGAGGLGWQEANPSSSVVAELNPTSTTTLAPNQSLDLGALLSANAPQDLQFQFFLAGATPDLRDGFVAYGLEIGPGLELDCNGDGVVDAGDLDCVCASGSADALLAELGLIAGDLDGDGSVAFADFVVLSANFGQAVSSYTAGDIDCDGTVAFADFVVFSANFGRTSGAQAASVPEPSGLILAAFCLLTLLGRRRRS